MYLGYALVCPLAYLTAGSLKFAVNTLKAGTIRHGRTGLGGIPSTHTSIVTSVAWLILLREGVGSPALAVSIALAMIVMIDAMDLRRRVGQVNRILRQAMPDVEAAQNLREHVGHTPVQVAAGIAVGLLVALVIDWF